VRRDGERAIGKLVHQHHWGLGAIYGVLLAFGVLYPETTILFLFLFPIQAKYFVMIYGAMALLGP